LGFFRLGPTIPGSETPRPMAMTLDLRPRDLDPPAAVFIRLAVGVVFLTEGVQKFLFPEALGVGRFTLLGLPHPAVLAPFVADVEVVAGLFLLVGLLTRLSALALLADISVAIWVTKLPMLAREGLWHTAHEARTDWAMLFGLLFLLVTGPGSFSLDAARRR
jgi:putative oxidoreductase